jgi:hypothetical protein
MLSESDGDDLLDDGEAGHGSVGEPLVELVLGDGLERVRAVDEVLDGVPPALTLAARRRRSRHRGHRPGLRLVVRGRGFEGCEARRDGGAGGVDREERAGLVARAKLVQHQHLDAAHRPQEKQEALRRPFEGGEQLEDGRRVVVRGLADLRALGELLGP